MVRIRSFADFTPRVLAGVGHGGVLRRLRAHPNPVMMLTLLVALLYAWQQGITGTVVDLLVSTCTGSTGGPGTGSLRSWLTRSKGDQQGEHPVLDRAGVAGQPVGSSHGHRWRQRLHGSPQPSALGYLPR